MSPACRLSNPVRRVLSERAFTDKQIEKLAPRIHEGYKKQPELLGEIVDTWNKIMASPSTNSLVAKQRVDMNTVLAEVEPDLLLLHPQKLIQRHENIKGLGVVQNMQEHWLILFNAPTGFYLQDWMDLTRKVYYIEHKVLDLLYDKKEQREMSVHPLVKSAAVVEADFDHIRTRYLFAHRAGFRELSHMHSVQTMLTRPQLKDLILADSANYLERFAPFCSDEEYSSFRDLIKNHDLDEEDADVCRQLAELDAIRHPRTVNERLREMRASEYSD